MNDLTEAEIRALIAVQDGKVERVYRSYGNILRGPKGADARVLWKLISKQLIEDASPTRGVIERVCRMTLTKAGKSMLLQTFVID